MPASPEAAPSAERILQRLDWQVVRRLDGLLQGDYRSLFYGYGVDSGRGCFIDAAALNSDSYQFERAAGRKLGSTMENGKAKGGFCGVIPIGKWGGPTLVGFSTGFGDGSYPSYWGFDKHKQIVTLDTDFGLLLESIPATVVFEGIMQQLGKPLQDSQMKRAGFSIRVRRQRHLTMPLVVTVSGSANNLTPILLLGAEEIHYRQSSHNGASETYSFEIARTRLTQTTALRLDFIKGIKQL